MGDFHSEQSWEKTFFATPNLIQFDDPAMDEFDAWMKIVLEGKNNVPLLLPRLSSSGLRWYACCDDEQSCVQTGEELTSLVAHAYASVNRYPSLDPADQCEAALLQQFGNNICIVDVDNGREEAVLNLFGLYRNLVARRPARARVGVRPSGRIRSEFDKALLVRNYEEAGKYIEELKGTGRLDLQNQRFLEIRLLAEQEKWGEIVVNPNYLRTVSDLALPAKILADLVEALYQTELMKYETANDPSGAIASFREYIRPRYPRLFLSRKGLRTPSVLKAFLLNELCEKIPEPSVCNKIVQEYPASAPGYDYIHQLFANVAKEPVTKVAIDDTATRADAAFEDDRFETALELYLSCDPSVEILRKIIRCIPWIEATTDLERAWEFCQSCPADWFNGLSGKMTKAHEKLKEQFSSKPVSGWCEWIQFVLQGGDKKKVEEILQRGMQEWRLSDYLIDDGLVESFCGLLTQGMDTDKRDYIQWNFSNIYDFFSATDSPLACLRPLYCELLQLLALADSTSESDLMLAQELSQSLIEIGLSDKAYADMIASINALWVRTKSSKHLGWALDMAEILAISPSPDQQQSSLSFFLSVVEIVAANRHRVDETIWMMLDDLGRDYNANEYVDKVRPAKEEEVKVSSELRNALAGKKIGIYSLTEPAALRAKSCLESMFSGVTVEVNHDHAATQSLENLAKWADLFVFAWRSSKHQAYFCVKSHTNEEKLLLPKGKGSSSIVSCLLERVACI